MIELIDFCKTYSKKSDFSVKNVSFKIQKGTITGLLGANGSGKSTIIKAICGFHFSTSGQILISQNDNCLIKLNNENIKVMDYIGYVPEISILPPDLTVIDFLEYCANMHFLEKNIIADRIAELCDKFKLKELLTKKIKTLSKGQQQRVSFAQALIHDPENLILDEPISGLDPAQIKHLREIIKDYSKTKAILMSTHILQEAHLLCNDIYIMNKGKIYPTKQNLSLEELEKEFIKISENNLE